LEDAAINYYNRHLGDYAAAAGHLSALEHGIYNLLIDWYYANEQPIPDSKAHRIARSSREDTLPILEEFFQLDGDVWRQKRIDSEIADYRIRAEKNRAIAEEREQKRRARLSGDQNSACPAQLGTEEKDLSTTQERSVHESCTNRERHVNQANSQEPIANSQDKLEDTPPTPPRGDPGGSAAKNPPPDQPGSPPGTTGEPSSDSGARPRSQKSGFNPRDCPPTVNPVAWGEWVEYLIGRRKTPTRHTVELQQRRLAAHDFPTQQRMVETSIEFSWQGLFEPKETRNAIAQPRTGQRLGAVVPIQPRQRRETCIDRAEANLRAFLEHADQRDLDHRALDGEVVFSHDPDVPGALEAG
jgi:uncharacterized protein YdaU (DUF1376 family)